MLYIATTPSGDIDLTDIVARQFRDGGFRVKARSGSSDTETLMKLYQLEDKFPLRIYSGNDEIGGAFYSVTVTFLNSEVRASFDYMAPLDHDSN